MTVQPLIEDYEFWQNNTERSVYIVAFYSSDVLKWNSVQVIFHKYLDYLDCLKYPLNPLQDAMFFRAEFDSGKGEKIISFADFKDRFEPSNKWCVVDTFSLAEMNTGDEPTLMKDIWGQSIILQETDDIIIFFNQLFATTIVPPDGGTASFYIQGCVTGGKCSYL